VNQVKKLKARIKELEDEVSFLRLCLLDTTMIKARSAIARLARIVAFIRSNDFTNATAIAAEFGTSTKTIHRDLHFLKTSLRLPLNFDAQRNGWKLDADAPLTLFGRIGQGGFSNQKELAELISAHNNKRSKT